MERTVMPNGRAIEAEMNKRGWSAEDLVFHASLLNLELRRETVEKAAAGKPVFRSTLKLIADTFKIDVKMILLEPLSSGDLSLGDLALPHVVADAEHEPRFFDRDDQRKAITNAWRKEALNVLCIEAVGGIGKTALVRKWLGDLGKRQFLGAEKVFCYSFDFRGKQVEPFVRKALRWFGDPNPDDGTPAEKGARLANLVRRHRTLLVLDALENILDQQGADSGTINDISIQVLVRELATTNPGLCLITSRQRLIDLDGMFGATVARVQLEHFTDEDGSKFLEFLGVNGDDNSRRALSSHLHGHCLALKLAASYLVERYHGDPAMSVEVTLSDDTRRFEPVRTILKYYEDWFGEGPILELLRALSLFNRAVDLELLESIRRQPIPGLNDRLRLISLAEVRQHLTRLQNAGLLEFGRDQDLIDSHPFVREYFRERLRQENPLAWQAANAFLFEHFIVHSKEEPTSFEDLDPLYQAISHGCRAGLYVRAWREVFWPRIRCNRGESIRNFNLRKFKAFGSDLGALREFFTNTGTWTGLNEEFTVSERARIFNEVGCDLRAQGRLLEAEAPLTESLHASEGTGHLQGAAEAAGNLSELCLRLGRFAKSVEWAELSAEHAEQSGHARTQIIMIGVLGNALHLVGRFEEAKAAFVRAEAIQAQQQPDRMLLHGVEGFQYLDLLLSCGEWAEVERRAQTILTWHTPEQVLMIALIKLAQGLAVLTASPDRIEVAAQLLNEAGEELVKAGRAEYLPRRFLALAALHRHRQQYDQALALLKEGETYALHHRLKISEIDMCIESYRAHAARGDAATASTLSSRAKSLIRATGYRLREEFESVKAG